MLQALGLYKTGTISLLQKIVNCNLQNYQNVGGPISVFQDGKTFWQNLNTIQASVKESCKYTKPPVLSPAG